MLNKFSLTDITSYDVINQFLGDNRDMEPPESISNSEVKRVIADDSVGFPHVKVGHHQVITLKPVQLMNRLFFVCYSCLRKAGLASGMVHSDSS